jgi:hypothetical protein
MFRIYGLGFRIRSERFRICNLQVVHEGKGEGRGLGLRVHS